MSAQLHRERKKAYLDKLEAQLKERTSECEALKAQVAHLTSENASLRGRLQQATGEPLAEPDVSGYLSSTTTSSESSPSPPSSPPQASSPANTVGSPVGASSTAKKAAMILFSVTLAVFFIGDGTPYATQQHQTFEPALALPASAAPPSRFAHGGRVLTSIAEPEDDALEAAAAAAGKELQLYPRTSYRPPQQKPVSVPRKLRGTKHHVGANATVPADISEQELELWLRNYTQQAYDGAASQGTTTSSGSSSSSGAGGAGFTDLVRKYTVVGQDASFVLCPKAFGAINIWNRDGNGVDIGHNLFGGASLMHTNGGAGIRFGAHSHAHRHGHGHAKRLDSASRASSTVDPSVDSGARDREYEMEEDMDAMLLSSSSSSEADADADADADGDETENAKQLASADMFSRRGFAENVDTIDRPYDENSRDGQYDSGFGLDQMGAGMGADGLDDGEDDEEEEEVLGGEMISYNSRALQLLKHQAAAGSADRTTTTTSSSSGTGAGTRTNGHVARAIDNGKYHHHQHTRPPAASAAAAASSLKASAGRGHSSSSPYMVLMMPTSQVRWNGSPLSGIHSSAQENATKAAGGSGSGGEASESESWLEIGVNLVHARIVSQGHRDASSANVNYAI